MTNINMINELNNNSIFNGNSKKKELPDSIIDAKTDTGSIPGQYKSDDKYEPYTIYGNPGNDDKLNALPQSTTGSLSSITTTSLASEPGGGGSGDEDGKGDKRETVGMTTEKWWQTTIQVSIPFFLAGIGTIGAGIILGIVETWEVFTAIPELFILVPALLGLKGNLDMCLASRLSTQANLGNMESKKELLHMVVGNISLVQVQATVAAFIVSVFSVSVGILTTEPAFSWDHAFLLTASAMFTATTSCFVLDFVLVAVIILTTKFNVNPDNMATPLAASIGDVVTIALLSFITSVLFVNMKTHIWVTYVVIGTYFVILPFWVILVLRNRYTRPVLKSGWVPVLSALMISGLSGLVLQRAQDDFSGFVVFSPIINGIGGNLVSVQASKISTMLYQSSLPGIIPPFTKIVEYPWRTLFYGTPYANTARILILMSIPGQVLFIYVADFIHHLGNVTIGAPFVFSYLTASLIQVLTLLYIAHVLVHGLWRFKVDPDTASIPYLTALGDFLGSSLLLGAFAFLRAIGHEYEGRDRETADLLTTTSEFLLNAVGGI
ncbi:CLUMA_CG004966, isoform A [Clunio marinus]|uniref:CLUMA_CG004966, isoform A n=1 Tax=Clunio marinus TaxID=568069 RepID=A0A1J1HT97_9DIPT|nr:CLUMA_CG004966, isoform A [Clunio marinus]